MTIHQNARFTCEMLVQDYIDNGKCTIHPFWDVMKIIKYSLELAAINQPTAERYCYQMHIAMYIR